MRRATFGILLAAWILADCSAAAAQDWTRFRGPNGAGQSDAATIPVEWKDADYNWKTALPGQGHSSPVLWGDKLFITSSSRETAERTVLCLSAKDGSIVWKRSFPSKTHALHEQNNYASSTPAVDKDHIYVAWATTDKLTLTAFNHDGQTAWTRDDLGPFDSQHGFGTSPIIYEDMVVMTDHQEGKNNNLFAFNRQDGKTIWQTPYRRATGDQNSSYSPPTIYTPKDGTPQLIVSSWGQGLTSFDPKTGKSLWEAKDIFPNRPVGCPIIVGDLILTTCGASSGQNYLFCVKPAEKSGPPTVAYKFDKASNNPYVPTPVVAGKLVFLWGDAGIVTCIVGETGKVEYRERVGGNYFGSPIRVGDRIYCISSDGDVVVLAASNQFKVLARNPLGEASSATPAVSNGVMYLRTQSHVMSLGGKKA